LRFIADRHNLTASRAQEDFRDTLYGPDGQLIPSTPKEKLDVSDYRFIFPQVNGGAIVITFPKRPKDSIITLIQSEKKNGKTAMYLRIPKVGKDAEVVIHTWVVAKDDAKLIRELK
jgi:hypothetical protein